MSITSTVDANQALTSSIRDQMEAIRQASEGGEDKINHLRASMDQVTTGVEDFAKTVADLTSKQIPALASLAL